MIPHAALLPTAAPCATGALTGCQTLAEAASASRREGTGSRADELKSYGILDSRPRGTIEPEGFEGLDAGCREDSGDVQPYADRTYVFPGGKADVTRHYRAAAERAGRTPSPATRRSSKNADQPANPCFTRGGADDAAMLDVYFPTREILDAEGSEAGPEFGTGAGYRVSVTASADGSATGRQDRAAPSRRKHSAPQPPRRRRFSACRRPLTSLAPRRQPSNKQKAYSAQRKCGRRCGIRMGFADQRFTVNLSILFTELPLLERPAAAAAAGFGAVELWWPWTDAPVPERAALDALKRAVEDAGVRLTGLNFYAGRLPGPDRGALSVPGEESDRFRASVEVAAGFAESLGCTALNALYGNRVEGVDPAEQDALALENLALAARAADRIGAALLIEALNGPESPRYPLVSAPAAVAVVDRVNEATGLGNAKFLMDLYHLAMNGEDLPEVIERFAARTGHVQIADSPGRGAPGTGSLPLEELLGRLRKAGYDGLVGLEYKPGDRPSAESFDWLPREAR